MNEPKERPLWKLDRTDRRLLAITFVGGVASIVVGAGLLGLAIATARNAERGNGFTLTGFFYITVFFGVMTLVCWLGTWRSKPGTSFKHSSVGGLAVALPFFSYTVLVWIGIAAGIH